MIIRNNARNRVLADKIAKAISSSVWFSPIVDKTWNCRKDIRIEIGVIGMDAPFIVRTETLADGGIAATVRVFAQEMDMAETSRLQSLLAQLDDIVRDIQALTAAAGPAREQKPFGKDR